MRKRVLACYRRFKRAKCNLLRVKYEEIYRKVKSEYGAMIKQAKVNSWKSFCSSQVSPWGMAYKYSRKPKNFNNVLTSLKTDNGDTMTAKETAAALANKFFSR